ncbi:HNH endonuclease [Paenibacillus glucanolyticus]|uniref:HNH endonuclease n=1 Tax=Paenibacillus glucanolyticus TaxID=59843 RepID=UPI0035D581DB
MPFPKKKKEIAPWRQNILSHHKGRPSRADRAEFPASVVKELIEEAGGLCQCGCGRPDTETHHVMPRTRDGRGVKTNGMRVNGVCNQRFHANEEELQHWINVYTGRYGPYFWYDDQDWEEYRRREDAELQSAEAQRLKEERLEPVMTLLSSAAGRQLRAKEKRLIESLPDKQMNVLADLMTDVVNGLNQAAGYYPKHGYGHYFED